MTRISLFTFRVSEEERAMLAALASSLSRSQSDALRVVLRNASEHLMTKSGMDGGRGAPEPGPKMRGKTGATRGRRVIRHE